MNDGTRISHLQASLELGDRQSVPVELLLREGTEVAIRYRVCHKGRPHSPHLAFDPVMLVTLAFPEPSEKGVTHFRCQTADAGRWFRVSADDARAHTMSS